MPRSVKNPLPWYWKWPLLLSCVILPPVALLAIAGWMFVIGYRASDPSVTPLFYLAGVAALALFCGWKHAMDLEREQPGSKG